MTIIGEISSSTARFTLRNRHKKEASSRFLVKKEAISRFLIYGDEGIRTLDPLLARQVLSQLSYTPKKYPGIKIHTLKTAHTNLCLQARRVTHCRSAAISCHLILRCASAVPYVCPCTHGHPSVPASCPPSPLLGQGFVRLVAVSSIHYCTSTPALSTSSSSRGLISF